MRAAATRCRVKGTRIYIQPQASSDVFAPTTFETSAAYDATGNGPRSKGLRVGGFGPNAALQGSITTLRNRSRDQARKNPYARAGVTNIVSETIGSGIRPQSQCSDRATREAIQAAFERWTDESDADGMFDFYGQQMMAMNAAVMGGDAFIRHRIRRPQDGMEVPFQLQLLEPDFCPVTENRMEGRDYVRQGIQFNAIGKRIAYWMYRQHPGDALSMPFIDTIPTSVPAAEVSHLYLPLRVGQIRGEPWLATILPKLFDLDGYDDAELVRKKTTALVAGFITKQEEGDTPIAGDATADSYGETTVTLQPGGMQVLRPGEDIRFSEPGDVGGNYEAFMRQQFRGIATGLGLLYEQLTGDYSNLNDRTLRAALNTFRRRCAMWQHHMVVYQFCRPVWSKWLALAEMNGAVARPDGMTDADFYKVKWVPEFWPYIHPVQDITALRDERLAGLNSRSQQVSARGYNAEDIDMENAADLARTRDMGITYSSDPVDSQSSANTDQVLNQDALQQAITEQQP